METQSNPNSVPPRINKVNKIPVIFANGKDDDLPGLAAAFKNETVIYNKRLYKPDEDIKVFGKTLILVCHGIFILSVDHPEPENPNDWTLIRYPKTGRKTVIENNILKRVDPIGDNFFRGDWTNK